MRNHTRKWKLCLALLFCLSGAIAAQETNRPLNYGFVSPNIREDLKIHEAIKEMESTEERKLVSAANNLHCVVRTRIYVYRALGSWSDGAEHTLMLRVRGQEPSVRYLLSQLGRDSQQKAVLYFHPQATGTANIYRLRIDRRRSLAEVAGTLDQAGVAFRTLVPGKSRTTVYVVDPQRELKSKVRVAAKRLKASLFVQRGKAEFIGADTRVEAKSIYDSEISSYEKSHPNLPSRCN